jgi:hypothetical protein
LLISVVASCDTNSKWGCDAGDLACQCSTGFADCTADAGCETDITTDAQNCGGCGAVCASGSCVAGVCQSPSDPNACVAVPPFSDNFDSRANGALTAPFTAPPVGSPVFVQGGKVCGDTQSVALICTHLPSVRIQFDWQAASVEGFEVAAIVAQADGSVITAYDFGMSGGSIPQQLQATQVSPTFASLRPSVDIAATFQINTVYRFVATVSSASREVTVSVGDAAGNVFTSLTHTMPVGFAFDHVGFLTGRNADGQMTCIDNFIFSAV